MFSNFDNLVDHLKEKGVPRKKVVVVNAHDSNTLEAVVKAEQQEIIISILIGNKTLIEHKLKDLNFESSSEIYDTTNDLEALTKMVEIYNNQEVDFIMKGHIESKLLMKTIVNKENGLNIGNKITNIALLEIPNYHKLLLLTDGGMIVYPNFDDKVSLIQNSVNYMRQIGYERPKVSVLASSEKLNLSMQESIDAVLLTRFGDEGRFGSCKVYGPLSYDLTVSKKAKELKGMESEVSGDADIIIVPDINSGNALYKSTVFSGGKGASILVGAKIPIIFGSRSSTVEERYHSILMASAIK